MKLSLKLAGAAAAFWVLPAAALAQNPALSCRPLSSTGNFVYPDEQIVGSQACKIVTTIVPPKKQPSARGGAKGAKVADAAAAPDAQPLHHKIVLAHATPVRLVLLDNVSSATATAGQAVNFEVAEDVLVEGLIVIPRGSPATGTITDAQAKRRMGKAGYVDINIDKVTLADGEKVLLIAQSHNSGDPHEGTQTPSGAVASVMPMRGRDAIVTKGTQLDAFINGDVALDAANFKQAPN